MDGFHVIHSMDGVYAYETHPTMMDYLVWIRDLLMEGEIAEDDMTKELAVEYQAIKTQIAEIKDRDTDEGILACCPSWEVRGGSHEHECSVDIASYWDDFARQAIDLFIDELKMERDRRQEDCEEGDEDNDEPTLAGLEQCMASWGTTKNADPNSEGFAGKLISLINATIEDCLPGF